MGRNILPLIPESGWADLNAIHTTAVVDKGFECSVVKLGEMLKLCGLFVRENPDKTARWQYQVAKKAPYARERSVESVPLSSFRRTLLSFLEDYIGHGEQYVARDVYDAFRRQCRGQHLTANALGRALAGSAFTTVTKRLNGVCTRVILRREDLRAETALRDRSRTNDAQVMAS